MRNAIAFIAVLMAGTASAESITGEASVVDSDVIFVDGKRVMLYGLESVERGQICWIDGKPWACYAAAVRHLEGLVSQGTITCSTVGEPDRYHRHLGLCEVNGKSLNEAFVRSGFALAREDEMAEYGAIEKKAKENGIGLWKANFKTPAEYRLSKGITVDRP